MKNLIAKSDCKKTVKIAESVVKKFVQDWKKKPYFWSTEADVHAELYGRIKSALARWKLSQTPTYYSSYMEKGQCEWFCRIYCKPLIYRKGGKYCFPDIVIKKSEKICDVKEGHNEPMIWACEIKYANEWSSLINEHSLGEDRKKLEALLKMGKEGVDCVCHLTLQRLKKGSGQTKILNINPMLKKGPVQFLEDRNKSVPMLKTDCRRALIITKSKTGYRWRRLKINEK